MKNIILLVTFFFAFSAFAQLNLQAISQVNFQNLHQTDLNDIWGYVDETGVEYALVGAKEGTSVVSLATPNAPVEVFWEPGMSSVWRDIKTWQNFAYVTTEANNGLLIIDLSPLPGNTNLSTSYYFGGTGAAWSSAHNLYIDSSGYAYIFGANRGNGGVIILDVHTDPLHPIEVGTFDSWYVHDGFALGNKLFLAHIEEGFFSVVDITNRSNPILLGTKTTPSNFSHNIWPSNDGNTVFTTDEVSGAYLASYDVSNPANIIELDRVQSSPGMGVIPHNVHVKDNYLVTSYYSDGVTVHDITQPDNMVLVGQYDTYPQQTTSYDGCWGAYPFLPSGLILATDITEGLFVLQPNYVQAAYLRGNITDATTNLPISGAKVVINNVAQVNESAVNGNYATGSVNGGLLSVTYSKIGYFPQTINIQMTQGMSAIQNVQLAPIPPYDFSVLVLEQGTTIPIENAAVLLQGSLIQHEGTTNGIGSEDFTLFYQENYSITVGAWGYTTNCFTQWIADTTGQITVYLSKGYYDDFTFDFGWTITGNATSGQWERGKPIVTNGGSPNVDADYDCGDKAYVTGNGNPSLGDQDLDNGVTLLTSPSMDLTSFSDPHLNYARWFFCFYGTVPNDTLQIFVSNGFQSVEVDRIGPEDQTLYNQWVTKSIRLIDYLPITNSMQVSFRVEDQELGNITEAGVDFFFISNSNVLHVNEDSWDAVKIYPNPTQDFWWVQGLAVGSTIELLNAYGQVLQSVVTTTESHRINVEEIQAGIYFIRSNSTVWKVIKQG